MTDLKAINISLKRKGDEGVAKDLVMLKVQYDKRKMRPPLSKNISPVTMLLITLITTTIATMMMMKMCAIMKKFTQMRFSYKV